MNDGTVRDTRTELTRGVLPALTLMVLAPVIAEVLSASTRISFIVVLIPEILVWGGGALLIRELVRRWGGGWTSMWLLGLGLAIAEEFLIQQTSLAPLPWIGDKLQYGRMYGVNWIYFLYMLGYESVWVVLVPVQLTELIFPERRERLWLGTRGMVIVAILFLPGAFLAWFGWTQIARPNTFHVAKYVPPTGTMACGALAILLLGTIAYKVRKKSGERRSEIVGRAVGMGGGCRDDGAGGAVDHAIGAGVCTADKFAGMDPDGLRDCLGDIGVSDDAAMGRFDGVERTTPVGGGGRSGSGLHGDGIPGERVVVAAGFGGRYGAECDCGDLVAAA